MLYDLKVEVPEPFEWASYIPNEKEAQIRVESHKNFVTYFDGHADVVILIFSYILYMILEVYADKLAVKYF